MVHRWSTEAHTSPRKVGVSVCTNGGGIFLKRKSIASTIFPQRSMDHRKGSEQLIQTYLKGQLDQQSLDSCAEPRLSSQPSKYAQRNSVATNSLLPFQIPWKVCGPSLMRQTKWLGESGHPTFINLKENSMHFFLADLEASSLYSYWVCWIPDTWIFGALRSEEKQVPLRPVSRSSEVNPTWSWLEMRNLGPHSQPAGLGSAFHSGSKFLRSTAVLVLMEKREEENEKWK